MFEKLISFEYCRRMCDESWNVNPIRKINFGIFEILKYYGTSGKVKNLNLSDIEVLWYILENKYLGIPITTQHTTTPSGEGKTLAPSGHVMN